jgi:mono/diheme cytochrome c family protein
VIVCITGAILSHGVTVGRGAAAKPAADAPAPDGKQLYAVHCAQCHGDTGDGEGPAAKFLYPRPRNFHDAQFRLTTTVNLMPTDDDLFAVVTRGMPGSAMFPFGNLSEAERRALVAHVRELTRTGLYQKGKRASEAAGEKVNPAELQQQVDELLKPGEKVALPSEWPAADDASVMRGNELYQKTCAPCHGATGKGDGAQDQRDSTGMPTLPRDFSRGIFKGGRDREQLYVRIMLGMPGTPMPSSNLQPAEVGDVINFIHSLSAADAPARVQHKRTTVVVRRVGGPLPADIPDSVWTTAPVAPLIVSPLWWRNYADPELTVRAVHDGRTIAVRLTWRDATRDDSPVRPEDFEDMAAVQFVKGPTEPFLGMGAADAPVELWFWQASWTARGRADVETAHPNMVVDMYPFEKPGGATHTIDRQPPEFITGKAAGNLRSDPNRGFTGSGLGAKGFGSVTMRPRASQLVAAGGAWADGRWTVTLRRPLAVPAEAGLTVTAGERVSAAIALWDGAARDRNGQKLVSIWHDLRLEP